MQESVRKQVLKRHEGLKKERSSWETQWQDIAKHVLPSTGRFLSSERNRGDKQFNRILDNEATRSVRILGAGMMGGASSPSSPWVKLAVFNADQMQNHAVQVWLDEVTRIIHTIFYRSNVYPVLHAMYEELAVYGTAACVMAVDYEDVVHLYPLTAGEYTIATNYKGKVDTLYREFDKTVAQLVDEFGREAVSEQVRNLYDNGQYDEWITVIHAIEPRKTRDSKRKDNKNMPYRSVYLEKGAGGDKVLRESGFRHFPALCPRWQVSGGDIYGTSPAMEALGDIKQLQHQQLRKGQAIDYQTRPPLRLPISLKNREADMLPGGVVYADEQAAIQPLWQVGLDLNALAADMQQVQQRIARAFYADIFLAITQRDTQMTATEVAERHQEKMMMLGPVLERLQNELFKPLVDFVFDVAFAGELFPPPPQELQGAELDVQFVSILAQAQKEVQTKGVDRFVSSVAAMAQLKPEVLDRLDVDAWVDRYADALGVPPQVIVAKDKADETRAARAEAQAQQQQQAQVLQMADAAQKLGNTPMGQGSALDGVVGGLSGTQ